VRGGATYREAHLAMEMICDSGKMVSMEVVEVNPVIGRIEPHGRSGGGADHVGNGKTHPMKLRVAVVYGGRSGEHEVSVRSARAIIDGLDRDKYEFWNTLSTSKASGRRVHATRAGCAAGDRRSVPVLHGTFARMHHAGLLSWPDSHTWAQGCWAPPFRWTRR